MLAAPPDSEVDARLSRASAEGAEPEAEAESGGGASEDANENGKGGNDELSLEAGSAAALAAEAKKAAVSLPQVSPSSTSTTTTTTTTATTTTLAGEPARTSSDPPGENRLKRSRHLLQRTPSARVARQSQTLVGTTKKAFIKYNLPIFMVLAIAVGLAWPLPGATLAAVDMGGVPFGPYAAWSTIGSLCVSLIFFMNGLHLHLKDIRDALKRRAALVAGLVVILGITPALAFAVAADRAGIAPVGLKLGVAVYQAMPTTITSGPAVVSIAKGHVEMALLLTLMSNLACAGLLALTVPALVDLAMASSAGATPNAPTTKTSTTIEPLAIVVLLVTSLIIPIVVGKILRNRFEAVAKWADKHALPMKILSSLLLAAVPWMTISANATGLRAASGGGVVAACVASVALHGFNLAVSYVTALATTNKDDVVAVKAVTVMGGQKSLPIAALLLGGIKFPEAGQMILPMTVAYLVQTVGDAVAAGKWANATKKRRAAAASSRPTEAEAGSAASGDDAGNPNDKSNIKRAWRRVSSTMSGVLRTTSSSFTSAPGTEPSRFSSSGVRPPHARQDAQPTTRTNPEGPARAEQEFVVTQV